jgi:hypothetical protein
MAPTIPHVRPGDLITATLFNQVLDELDDLQKQIDSLGAGSPTGPLSIISLLPTGPVRIGTELRIIGTGFGDPSTNVVTFDGILVNQIKPGSSGTMLIVDVPALQGVPSTGKNVAIHVSNVQGTVSIPVVVLPFLASLPTGTLALQPQGSSTPTVVAGQAFDYTIRLSAITNSAETYNISATVDLVGWAAVIRNTLGQPISSLSLAAGPPPSGVSGDFIVRVSVPAGAATGAIAKVTINAASQLNPLQFKAPTRELLITVGSPPPPQQQVSVQWANTVVPPGTLDSGGTRVVVPVGVQVQIPFNVTLPQSGQYDVTPSFLNASGWGTPDADPLVLSGTNVTTSALVTATSSAVVTKVKIRVQKQGNAAVFGEGEVDIRKA